MTMHHLLWSAPLLTVSLARHPFGGWCCSKLRTPFRDLGFSSSRTLGGKVRLSVKPIHQDGAILWSWQIVPPHVLQAWSELPSPHYNIKVWIYLQHLVIVHEFFITHAFNFSGITISHRSTWNTCWRFSLYPFYPFSVITTSHECWVYHAAFGLPTTQLPRSVTWDQSFSVAAQFGNHGNTQQSSYFFNSSVLPWLPHYQLLCCKSYALQWEMDTLKLWC